MTEYHDEPTLAALDGRIDGWLDGFRAWNSAIVAVDRGEPGDPEPRWYVRMRGEDKEFTTIWITLGQRTVRYETYVMPAPEEHAGELYEFLLRRNESLIGAHFSIGVEDAVFLRGELPLSAVTEDELDRVIGTLYVTVEQYFQAMLRIGFRSRFASPDDGSDPLGVAHTSEASEP